MKLWRALSHDHGAASTGDGGRSWVGEILLEVIVAVVFTQ